MMADINSSTLGWVSVRHDAPTVPRPFSGSILPLVSGLALAFLLLPIVGLLVRMPWSRLGETASSGVFGDAIALSAVTSLTATAVSVILGTPLAWTLSRMREPFRRTVRALVLLPMVLPPVVGGTALLFALGRRGVIGQLLDRWFQLVLPFSTTGAIIAAAFVALPFYVVTVESAMRQIDSTLLEAANTMGATRRQLLQLVVMPLVRPSVIAGAGLAWARALGEFGATVTFAGSLQGRTQTLPLAMFQALESGRVDEALVMSLLLLATSFAVLVLFLLRSGPDET